MLLCRNCRLAASAAGGSRAVFGATGIEAVGGMAAFYDIPQGCPPVSPAVAVLDRPAGRRHRGALRHRAAKQHIRRGRPPLALDRGGLRFLDRAGNGGPFRRRLGLPEDRSRGLECAALALDRRRLRFFYGPGDGRGLCGLPLPENRGRIIHATAFFRGRLGSSRGGIRFRCATRDACAFARCLPRPLRTRSRSGCALGLARFPFLGWLAREGLSKSR
jgi:hypothetical protein